MLNEYCAIDEYLLFNHQDKTIIENKFVDISAEKQIKQFLVTYLTKQQSNMDIVANMVIFKGSTKSILIFRHEKYFFCCAASPNCDIGLLSTKMEELWVRFTLDL
jgi:hypothetical protein